MAQDAIALLESDHQRVETLFRDFQSSRADLTLKFDIAQIICMELTMHSTLEEELFYPAFAKASGEEDMVKKAQDDHQAVKELIAQVPTAPQLDAIVKLIIDDTLSHIQEERLALFPKARSCGMDLEALGEQIERRKAEFAVQAA